jgi:hypothetical protein
MTDQYHVDLGQFSLERFKHILEAGDLLPSQRILKEDIPGRFAVLTSMGITNLQELLDVLKTKKRIEQFARESGLPLDYLTILRRRMKIYQPSPIPLAKIPGIASEHIEHLAAVEIKQTRQLFERARSKSGRSELVKETGIPEDVVLEMVKLSDLARAGYVGPIFARMLHETGKDTLEKLAQSSPTELHAKLLAVNEEQKLTRVTNFTIKDIASCVEIAQMLPKVVEY